MAENLESARDSGRATIGVQQPSSDPHQNAESFDAADLAGLTQEVSAVIERARAKWEDETTAIVISVVYRGCAIHPAHER